MHNICDDSDSNKKKINRVRIYSRLKFNNYFREWVFSKILIQSNITSK